MCRHPQISRRRFALMVPGLALVASGLASGCAEQTTGPAEIKWGRDHCDYCGMIIDDARFATQLRGGPKRKLFKFDDPGDAVLFLAKQDWRDDPATEIWVGSLETGQWLDARKAFWIDGQRSPMAHGYGAIAQSRPGSLDFTAFAAAIRAKGSTTRCEPGEGGGAAG
jgi:nitrous oxide reductase accessory protein NosL